MDIDNDLMLCDVNDAPSISDLIRECQYEGNNFHLTMNDYDWLSNTNSMSPNDIDNEVRKIKEETYDEDSNSSVFIQEQLPVSLFKETKHHQWSWSETFVPSKYNYYYYFLFIYIIYVYTMNNICIFQMKTYHV